MISTISVKYSLSSCAIASGPIDSAIAVKPRMSLKSTVDRPALAAQADGAVLLRDLGGDVGREVALEVGADVASRRICSA